MKQSPTVAIATHGCKLNQAESDALARRFAKAGYVLVGPNERADVYILNTCTVTHIADRKARHWLRWAHRLNHNACVIATGCYAERSPRELSQIQGVHKVIGNQDKERLVEKIEALLSRRGPEIQETLVFGSFKTRAFVKIQDGCNQFCSFCVIPLTRGRERSLPISGVLEEVRARVAEGFKEVVLTGPQIGSYGMDQQPRTAQNGRLENLVWRILDETEVQRLRISSIQPQDLTQGLLSLWSNPRFCRHVHVALQSGSDFVLRRMRRRYTTSEYERIVALLREAVPDVSITTDVMVGFPGETDEEFEESYRFCRQIGFAGMHIFPFSPRPGTRAATMQDGVTERVKTERMEMMLRLSEESGRRFRERFLGRTMLVLWEDSTTQDLSMVWSGLTDNYIRVLAKSEKELSNQLMPAVLLSEAGDGGLWGRLLG
ncbi:MAG: tRNA (N(6)-L-threonylcarbamoyladenosine(37)-C(2))-methylthiotransferase MtaB [Chloroflexi bacterium]|nr:tRNA (N(6)-L-threonylcarbamoyladenosine(37)-C(2))-methylthiotransferase MtaB [Chloroflexota bacterium]